MIKFLVDSLSTMFEVQPEIFANLPKTVNDFLKEVVKAAGPLFIVLDEIGAAFHDDKLDDIQCRDLFLSFCDNVLGKWLSLKNVFFLALGRGSFFSYVGLRPTIVKLTTSSFLFRRLNLHLLRTDAIKKIIKRTLVFENEEITLQKHLCLDESQVELAAEALYNKTSGHPRSIIEAFTACDEFQDILEYEVPVKTEIFNSLFFDHLFRHRDVLEKLILDMEEGRVVDLTTTATDPGGKSLTYDIIANNAFISWEGTVNAARLYTLPFVKIMLKGIILPFRKYLECLGMITGVSVDYANAFEWMSLKRFQEIFSLGENRRPADALPLYFNTPIFGNCLVTFSSTTRLMPKITESGNHISSLQSLTAHPENWKDLLALIDG